MSLLQKSVAFAIGSLDSNKSELLKDFFCEAQMQTETLKQNMLVLETESGLPVIAGCEGQRTTKRLFSALSTTH
jgi:metal-dependent hydrolase (beta-lactamase superfamily II)